jgi:hypothetical protein
VTPAPSLNTVLSRIGEIQPPLPPATSVLIGLAALVLVSVQGLWLLARYADTIAHEGTHAIVGSALGRPVDGVTLERNGDGATSVLMRGTGGDVLIYFVGYLGPSAFGLGAAKLIEIGHIVAVLWLTVLLLAVMLVMVRNPFGFVSVLVTGGLIYLFARYATVSTQTVAAYGVAWFLLLSGVRKVIYRGPGAGDAVELRRVTSIGRSFWFLLWLIGTSLAVVVGGSLLV